MVDIVHESDTLAKIQKMADRSINVIENNVFWNKLVNSFFDIFLNFFGVSRCFKNILENLERNFFINAVLFNVKINISGNIYHAVTNNLNFFFYHSGSVFAGFSDIVFFYFNSQVNFVHTCLFNFHSLIEGKFISFVGHDFTRQRIDNGSGKNMTGNTCSYA